MSHQLLLRLLLNHFLILRNYERYKTDYFSHYNFNFYLVRDERSFPTPRSSSSSVSSSASDKIFFPLLLNPKFVRSSSNCLRTSLNNFSVLSSKLRSSLETVRRCMSDKISSILSPRLSTTLCRFLCRSSGKLEFIRSM